MNRIRWTLPALVAPLLVSAVPVPPAAPAAPAGLCRAGETVLFTCGIAARQVSVCGSGSGATAAARYRLGTPAKVELEYPAAGQAGRGTMAYASIPYSGGGETQIHFTSGGYTYVVYSRVVRTNFGPSGRHDPAFSAGVVVQRDGKTLSHRKCTAPTDASVDLAAAQRFLPEGEAVDVP
ncbi:hypothetical protein ACG3SL_07410 [Sphingomonas sp. CJ20]